MSSSCASPSRRYHLLPPAGPGPIINTNGKGGSSSHTGSAALMVAAHETTLLRWLGLCTAALLLLDIWAWVAPGVLAPPGTEHTVADFDSASLLYLVPLTLHALAALSFFTHKRQSPLALWAPAVRLRVVSLACLALAVPTLLARVVTLQQYCRLEGRVAEKEGQEEEEGSNLFKACISGHVGLNAAVMAIASTLLGLLLLQTLTHLEALCQWQQQHQHGLHAHHRLSSHDDGHTPPSGCGFDEEAYYDYSGYGSFYYVPPPLPFPFHQRPRGQRQQQQRQAWSLASAATTGSSSFGSSMPSPERYLHQHRAGPLASSSSSSSSNAAAAVVYPGVSAAAAATAQTLYGDVSQYDDPPPRVLVHRPPFSSGSGMATADGDEEEGGGEAGGGGSGGDGGSGGPLTLSSGGPGSSAFSNYVVAPATTTS